MEKQINHSIAFLDVFISGINNQNLTLTFITLKVVSAKFLPVLPSLNWSTCQTRKNIFCFTSEGLFVLEKIKFLNSTFSNFMTSSNA